MRTPTVALVMVFFAALASCSRNKPPQAEAEAPTLDITSWTEKTELFMEHPPLVAGEIVRFAVHLTQLADFSALNAGRPSIELTPSNGGSATTLPGTEPLRPGAFRVEGKAPAAGQYRWALLVRTPNLSDRHDLGTITVFADQQTAFAAAEQEGAGDASAISYLKEQQWTNEFATASAAEVELRTAIRVPAVIDPLPGGSAIVAAPTAGRFAASRLPSVGDAVAAGQTLGRLEPQLPDSGTDRASLQAAVAEAQIGVDAARADAVRAERLLAERAVPARRAEDARRALAVAEARLQAAQARLAQRDETLRSGGGAAAGNAYLLRAPIAGRLAEVLAALGASYDQSAPLFRIVRTDRVELVAQVPPADAPLARQLTSLAFEVPGRRDPILLKPEHVHDAGIVDPQTHALPLQMEVRNPDGQLLVGQSGTAIIYTPTKQKTIAVPSTAILTAAGRPYVFVQVGGESFSRRFVDIAARDGDLVGVRSGVKPGERVVTRGAYEVQLASAASGLPAEGHVH